MEYITPQIKKYSTVDDLLKNHNRTFSHVHKDTHFSIDDLLDKKFTCIVGEPGIGKIRDSLWWQETRCFSFGNLCPNFRKLPKFAGMQATGPSSVSFPSRCGRLSLSKTQARFTTTSPVPASCATPAGS